MTTLQRIKDILAIAVLTLAIYHGLLIWYALDAPSTSERPAGAGISLPAPAPNQEDV